MSVDKRLYHTLDAMRGVAAIMIVLWHARHMSAPIVLPSSYLAVDLFFVLSGFVLAFAYDGRLEHGMGTGRFFITRVIRLYPLYICGTLIGIFSGLVAYKLGAGELNATGLVLAIVAGLLMLPSPTFRQTPDVFVLNGPAWSLFFELFINLVFALFWKKLTRTGLIAIIAVSGLLMIVSTIAEGHCDLGHKWTNFIYGFPRVTFSFFVGVLIHRLFKERRESTWIGLVLPFVLIPIFAFGPTGTLRIAYDLLCVMVVFPLLIIAGAAYDPPPLGVGISRFLGLISYPLYAIHVPIIELTRRTVRVAHYETLDLAPALGIALTTVLVFVSWPLVKYYDEPVRRALTQRFAKRRELAPAQTT